MLSLKTQSSKNWIETVIGDFDHFLIDHADCERKAAATAMALVSRFPDYPEIVEPMISLAREELSHFRSMYRIIQNRGLVYSANQKDPYISQLLKFVRHPEKEYFLDRLLLAAIIEERACERLETIAPHIADTTLQIMYAKLAEEEKAHGSIFVKLAKKFFDRETVDDRLEQWITTEADVLESIPLRAAIH